MRFRALLRLATILVASCSPALVEAQQIGQLTRVTPTTGLADSSLFLCVDSTKTLTRACKFNDIQKRLAFKAWDTVSTTKLNLTGATITGSPTWSSTFTAAAGQRVDSATGAARASGLVGSPAITVSSCTGCGGGGATVSDTVKNVTFDSVRAVRVRVDTIRSRAGASKRLVVQTTTSGSASTTAVRFNEVQQSIFPAGTFPTPTLSFSNDTTTGFYSSAAANWRFILSGGVHTQFTAAGITLSSNGSNTGSFIAGGAGAATTTPDFTFGNSPTTGMYRFGADTIGFATSGAASLGIRGGASPTIFGGAGNLTVQCGTGNSRTCSLQSTTSAGTPKNTLVLGADSSATILGTVAFTDTLRGVAAGGVVVAASGGASRSVKIVATNGSSVQSVAATFTSANVQVAGNLQMNLNGSAGAPTVQLSDGNQGLYRPSSGVLGLSAAGVEQMEIGGSGALTLPLLPAEGSTKNAMCWDGTTHVVTQNAAATCTVSSARFKKNIVPIGVTAAWSIVSKPQLHSSTYEEREGGRKAIGIIAEQADSADSRLASRDAKGTITSTNYEEVTSLLLMIVKDQQRRLDSLVKVLSQKKGAGSPTSTSLTLSPGGQTVLTITPDGRFILGPAATTDDAARAIVDLATKMFAGQTIQQRKPQ